MTRDIRFTVRAQRDIETVKVWYARQRSGLDVAFSQELDELLQTAHDSPRSFALVGSRSRRALMAHFPYHVYFVERTSFLLVTGVFHAHRRPGSWGDRVREECAAPYESRA